MKFPGKGNQEKGPERSSRGANDLDVELEIPKKKSVEEYGFEVGARAK